MAAAVEQPFLKAQITAISLSPFRLGRHLFAMIVPPERHFSGRGAPHRAQAAHD